MKTTFVILLMGFMVIFGFKFKPGDNAETTEKDQSGLIPVSVFRNGYSAEETMHFRNSYNNSSAVKADDVGSYANLHVSEVINTAVVHRNGDVAWLENNLMPEIEEVTATTDLGELTLREMMDHPDSRMKGIAVVHKGELVYENYIGMRPADNHLWASAAKSLNGILIDQLENEGLVDLTKSISYYLPELNETAWADVSVADVLHQRSGLDIREGSLGEHGHPITKFYATFSGGSDLAPDASFMTSVTEAGKLRESGELFEYSSINTYVLGMIIERVTEQPFHDVVSERIWSKAGMEGDALLGLSPTGEPSAFGIFASRLRDFARYGMLYTPSWNVVADEPVVSENYLQKVYAASIPEIFPGNNLGDRMIRGFGDWDMGASYQWDAVFMDGDLYKSGRNGQALYISPDTDTVVVWFSTVPNSSLWVHAYAREIVEQVFRTQCSIIL